MRVSVLKKYYRFFTVSLFVDIVILWRILNLVQKDTQWRREQQIFTGVSKKYTVTTSFVLTNLSVLLLKAQPVSKPKAPQTRNWMYELRIILRTAFHFPTEAFKCKLTVFVT
jgi:hypothetical protein